MKKIILLTGLAITAIFADAIAHVAPKPIVKETTIKKDCSPHWEMAVNALASEGEWEDIAEVEIGAGAKDAWFMASKARKVFYYHKKNYEICMRGGK